MNRDDLEIGREFLGYKKDDVDMILAALNHDLRNARDRNSDLLNRNEELRSSLVDIEKYAEKLRTLLENGEKTSRLITGQAKADANVILNNAHRAASEILDETEAGKRRVQDALSKLDEADRRLSESFSKTLNSYLDMIETISQNGLCDKNKRDEPSSTIVPLKIDDNGNGASVSLSQADAAIIKAHMGPLIDIDGVSAAFLFDNNGTIITHVSKPDVVAEAFFGLPRSITRLSSRLSPARNTNEVERAFIQLKDLILTIQRIDDSASVFIVSSENTNFELTALLINQKREHISNLLLSINNRAD